LLITSQTFQKRFFFPFVFSFKAKICGKIGGEKMQPGKLIMILTGVLGFSACTQNIKENDIPSVVLNSLESEFRDALDVQWEKQGAVYEAKFEYKDRDHDVLIDNSGKLLRYKIEILEQNLPVPLRDMILTKYNGIAIEEIHQLVIEEKFYYQIEFDGRLTNPKKVFNDLGEEMEDIHYYGEF